MIMGARHASFMCSSKQVLNFVFGCCFLVVTGSSQMMPQNEGRYGIHSPLLGKLRSFTFVDTWEAGHVYRDIGSTEADKAEREVWLSLSLQGEVSLPGISDALKQSKGR